MPSDHIDFAGPALERALRGLPFGRPLQFFSSLGSTNVEARRLAEAGAPAGALVVADEQTAGRGRAGRAWQTPPGVALAASFILRPALPPARLARVTMLGGLAAAEAIEEAAGVPAGLKWPNDVLAQGKKVAGVLTEAAISGARLDYAVLGIGINVNGGPPPAPHFPAAALSEIAGAPADRAALLVALCRRLGERHQELDGPSLPAAWAARLAWRGERVRAEGPGGTDLEGRVEGVDADGALLLRLDSGAVTAVAAGDVSLRPALPPIGAAGVIPTGAGDYRPVRFIGETIEAGFARPPALEKKPGCPAWFTWRGERFCVTEMVAEWHDYRRRGRMARNMQPAHAAVAETRGSWGVGRDYFRVRTADNRIFDLYYDRAPQGTGRRKGGWVLFAEVAQDSQAAEG